MERTIEVEVSLNVLEIQERPIFCQGDKNTHFLSVRFMEDVDLTGYTLQVYYLPPYPCVTPYVDLYSEITSNPFKVPIPNKILERNGQVKVEFSLSKESELITVNKTFNFEVIRTMNGTGVTAYPEGELKLTIAQQIEKIKTLLADTDNKIAEYNNNATSKTEQYNNNSDEKLKSFNQNDTQKTSAFNDNADSKLKTYNDNDVLKTRNYNNNAEEKKSEFNNNATQVANKFTDYISDTLNKATTEMDRRATASANAAGERANQEVKNQEGLSVQAVTNEGTKQVDLVVTKGTEEVEKIQAAGTQAVSDINANKDAHVKAVTDEGNKQVLALGNKGTEEVSKVQSAGAKAVEDVNANKTANIQAVTEEGTKQTGLVADKGAEQIKLVKDEGTKQATAVENKGTEQISLVTAEGNKQLILTQAEAIKVIEQLKSLIAGNPDTSNAQALSGKSRIEFERDTQALAGKYAGNFPLTSAVKDAVYLVPATGKFYVCTQAYNGSNLTAPNANFEEMSVWANRDKLGNLFKYTLVEEKISKRLDHQIDIGILGHAIFESVNYQNLPDGFYRIVSKRMPDETRMNYVDFQFENKKITKTFNLTFWSDQQGRIIVDLNKQAIAISAHSGTFYELLKVRLYRVE